LTLVRTPLYPLPFMGNSTDSQAERVRPLSVCLVTGEYPPAIGGIADYTASLAQALCTAGVRVTVCTSRVPGRQVAPADVPVVEVPSWHVRSLRAVAAEVANVRPDIVHLQYQAAAFAMSPAVAALPFLTRRRGTGAFVTTFHDLRPPYLFPKAGPLRRWFNHGLIGASDAVVFTEPSDLARAHSRRPAFWVPLGSSLSPRAPIDRQAARRKLKLAEEDAVIASFGFSNASKGTDVLLRAAERLSRAGVPLQVLLIGDETGSSDPRNRETDASLRGLADELGIADRVTRTGHLPPADVSLAMAAADVAALPFVDGASLRRSSLFACLAHGLPVVTTTPATTPPLAPAHRIPPFTDDDPRLDDRVVATFPRGDDAALARELYRLLDDPARRASLGEAGRAFASRFDWDSIAEGTRAVYNVAFRGRAP
jgi:polysaccharide biosynthesis protein PslF